VQTPHKGKVMGPNPISATVVNKLTRRTPNQVDNGYTGKLPHRVDAPRFNRHHDIASTEPLPYPLKGVSHARTKRKDMP